MPSGKSASFGDPMMKNLAGISGHLNQNAWHRYGDAGDAADRPMRPAALHPVNWYCL
jgi:hypothetical protein